MSMSAQPAVAASTYPLIGVFDDPDAAERAYATCVQRGYEIGQVNVVVSEGTRRKLIKSGDRAQAELATRRAQGGELGGPKGGRAGLLVTVFAAVGAAVVVPAIGFAAGPLAIAMTAAGAAGVAGSLIAVMGDWGVPVDRVQSYQSDIRKGAILMSLEARSVADANAIADEWRKLGGRSIHIA
jgi:hypothetical protein